MAMTKPRTYTTGRQHPDHAVEVVRVNSGSSPIRGGGRFYGTVVRCSCGWSTRSNEAPSSGGRAFANEAYATHVAWETAFPGRTPGEVIGAAIERHGKPAVAEAIPCSIGDLELRPGNWDAPHYRLYLFASRVHALAALLD